MIPFLAISVTLHAERRIYCTFFGIVTSVTGALRELEDTAEKNFFSAKKNKQPHNITRVCLRPNGNLSVHFRQS